MSDEDKEKPSLNYILKHFAVFISCVVIIDEIALLFVEHLSAMHIILGLITWIVSEVISEKCYPLGPYGMGGFFVKNKE